MEVIQCDLFEY